MKGGKPNEPEEPVDKASLRLNQFLQERSEVKAEDSKLIEEVKKKGKIKAIISKKE